MKKLTIQFKNQINQIYLLILIIFLLFSSGCSLFFGSWEDGIKLVEKGEVLLKEKKYEESIEAFSKAIAIIENIENTGRVYGETLARIYKFRGTAYFNLKNYDKSLEDLNKSIEINRNGTESAYPERGNLFLVKKDYEKALADFEIARPYYSYDHRRALGMAIAYYETQKYEKANEFISSALSDLRQAEEEPYYVPDDHIKAYEYSIKLSEQKGDTKNVELEKQSLEYLKKKHNKN